MTYNPERVVKQLGKKIAQLRRERRLSQGAFAAKLRSTPQWVSSLERGMRSPTLDCKIANALGVALAELFSKPT